MIDFSLVIPVYNVAGYLRECLDSVLLQAYPHWEAICVDDGSTDGSSEILDGYALRDSRFRVFHLDNQGVSAARNFGIEKAKGNWIGFVDGDDVILPGWLTTVRNHVDDSVDLIRLRCRTWFGEKVPSFTQPHRLPVHDYTGKTAICDWFWREMVSGGWSWLLVFRGTFLRNCGCRFPMGVAMREDCIFEMDVLPHLKRVRQLEYEGYLYRQRKSSAVAGSHSIDDWLEYCRKAIIAWRWSDLGECAEVSRQVFYGYQDLLAHVRKEDCIRLDEAAGMLVYMLDAGLLSVRSLPMMHSLFLRGISHNPHGIFTSSFARCLLSIRPQWRSLRLSCRRFLRLPHG